MRKEDIKRLIPDIILVAVVLIAVVAIIMRSTTYREDIAPINDSDLRPVRAAEVAPEDNAFTYLSRATNAMCLPKDFGYIYYYGTNEDETWASNGVRLVRIITSNETAFAEVDKSLACSKCQFPETTNDIVRSWSYAAIRDLCLVLSLKSDWLSRSGKGVEAFDAIMKEIRIGQMIQNADGSPPIYGSGLKTIGLLRMENMLCSCTIPSAYLKRYAHELLSCRINDESLKNGFRQSYVWYVKFIDDLSKGNVGMEDFWGYAGPRKSHWPIPRYLFDVEKTKRMMVEQTREMIRQVPMNYSRISGKTSLDYEPPSWRQSFVPTASANTVAKFLNGKRLMPYYTYVRRRWIWMR